MHVERMSARIATSKKSQPRVYMVYRKRPVVRKRKVMKKKSVPRGPRLQGPTGGCVLTRRVPSLYIANSSTFGAPAITNTSPTACIAVGTATAHPYFGNNFTVPFSMQFSLDQLAQYTDITGFCDRYKILDVSVKFQYNSDSITGVSTTGQAQPNMVPSVVWIQDYDDAAILSIGDINAKTGVKRKALNNGSFHAIRVKPRLAQAAYQAGVTTAYTVPGKATWVNTAYQAVPHYGIKGYIENMYLGGLTSAASCITIDVTMKVALKDFQ